MASLLYGVSALDPITFAAVAILALATTTLACYFPATRATKGGPHDLPPLRINPVTGYSFPDFHPRRESLKLWPFLRAVQNSKNFSHSLANAKDHQIG